MELMEALQSRRAVREFRSDKLSHETVRCLIQAAILAPSANNLQPWAFAALLDPTRIEEYAERTKEWLLQNLAQSPFGESGRHILEERDFSVFHHAPALVIILAQTSASQAAEDCCLAAENLMLAARDQGIGSCCIGLARHWLNLPLTKKELNLPENYQVIVPIVLGYPKTWPESHGRKPAEVYWL